MLTDIEIAQRAQLKKIRDIASDLGITEDELEPYGHYKAKITEACIQRLSDKPDGKLILVTAINPTPAGEGKNCKNRAEAFLIRHGAAAAAPARGAGGHPDMQPPFRGLAFLLLPPPRWECERGTPRRDQPGAGLECLFGG